MSQTNSLPAANGHFISLSKAIEMTSLYRLNRENILGIPYKDRNILALNETFNRTDVDILLAIPGCEGLRIYYGMDEELKVHAIIVPVNENNEDILPLKAENYKDDPKTIVEEGQRCPVICPPPSPLNEP